jgi:peroxiredoxin
MKRLAPSLILAIAMIAASHLGAAAQSAAFTRPGGERVDLKTLRGKVVVLAVGARWLPLTKGQLGVLNRLEAEYREGPVALFLVLTDGSDTTDAQVSDFAKTNKLAVPVLRDPRGTVTEKFFEPDQMPAYIVVGKDGKVIGRPVTGFDSKTDMTPTIRKLIESGIAG